jgi:putative membrane protein
MVKARVGLFGACLMALAIAAPAQDKPQPKPQEPKPKEAFSDTAFLADVNRANLLEIAMGQLTGTQSMNVDIKTFGQKMVTDHQKLNADLTDLAARKKISLPGKLTDDQQKMVDDMGKLSGDVFDKRYMSHMVSAHEKAVESFKKAATDAKDADIKGFAAGTLSKLEEHLKEAKELRDKIGGAQPKPEKKPKPGEPEKPLPDKPDNPRPLPPDKPDRP